MQQSQQPTSLITSPATTSAQSSSVEQEAAATELCNILISLNFAGQQISLTSDYFKGPNFPLVCQILQWFAEILKRPVENVESAQVKPCILADTNEKVAFLVHVGKLIYSTLGVRINLVNLYRADLSCCPELLACARYIRDAALLVAHRRIGSDERRIGSLLANANLRREHLDQILSTPSSSMNPKSHPESKAQLQKQQSPIVQNDDDRSNTVVWKTMEKVYNLLNNNNNTNYDRREVSSAAAAAEDGQRFDLKIVINSNNKSDHDNKDDNLKSSANLASSTSNRIDEPSKLVRLVEKLNELITSSKQMAEFEENELRAYRASVMDRRFDITELKQTLVQSSKSIEKQMVNLQRVSENLQLDSSLLEEKLRKKEFELEETQRNYDLLLNPNGGNRNSSSAINKYRDQYDELRQQYELEYSDYVAKYKNLMYLKDCLYSKRQRININSNGAIVDDAFDMDEFGGDFGDENLDLDLWLAYKYQTKEFAAFDGDGPDAGSGGAALVGAASSALGPGSATVGPARLLESLLETGGSTSKPSSMSLGGAAAAPTDKELSSGLVSAATKLTAGAAPAATTPTGGRPERAAEGGANAAAAGRTRMAPVVEAGDALRKSNRDTKLLVDGLELEGLLNEFMLDTAGSTRSTFAGETGGKGEAPSDEEDQLGDDDDDEEPDEASSDDEIG